MDCFRDEIELLYIDEFKQFVRESLSLVPTWQYDNNDIELTKETVRISKIMVESLEPEDFSHDLIISASILHAICKYDQVEGGREEDEMHQFHVRNFLSGLQGIIGREQFNSLMYIIEGQRGFQSPIPQVMPKIDDPIHIWVLPLSIVIAKAEVTQ